MGRFLKKLSSLCLALVLGTSGFFSLNAAACVAVPFSLSMLGHFTFTQEQLEDVRVVELESEEEFAKLKEEFAKAKKELPADIFIINSKLSCPIVRINFNDKRRIELIVAYCQIRLGFAAVETALEDLLREFGEEELAEKYKNYRIDMLNSLSIDGRCINREQSDRKKNDAIFFNVRDFFLKNKFKVNSTETEKVGFLALFSGADFNEAYHFISKGWY